MRKFLSLTTASFLLLAAASTGINAADPVYKTVDSDQIEKVIIQLIETKPEIVTNAFYKVQAKQRQAQATQARAIVKDNKALIFESPNDFVTNKGAKQTIVEFFDYNCGYCKRVTPTVQKFSQEGVSVIFKEFPILSNSSRYAAKAAIAVKLMHGPYEDFHHNLMKHSGSLTEEKVLEIATSTGIDTGVLTKTMSAERDTISSTLAGNQQLARRLGITGTPAFVVGEEVVKGAASYNKLASKLNDSGKS